MNTTTITRSSLDHLSEDVAERGIEEAPVAVLAELARMGRSAGVAPVVCEVLTDPAQPEVARVRAFSRVSSAVSGRVRPEHDLAA